MEATLRERIAADRPAIVSSLWLFVLLNMVFRDLHEFARPGAIEEFMALEVSEGLILGAGIVLTLFISMIVLVRVLPVRINRWANLVVPVLALGSMVANMPRDLDDIWFLAVEVLGLLAIIALAWTWRTQAVAVAARA